VFDGGRKQGFYKEDLPGHWIVLTCRLVRRRARMAHKIFPHKSFQQIAPGVWQLEGSLPFPLKRNMTVVKLSGGGLLIYSAIALDDAGFTELEKLGNPEIIVVPQPFHVMDLAFYKQKYPQLRVLGPKQGEEFNGVRVEADVVTALTDANVMASLAPGLKNPEVHLKIKVPGGYALCVCDIFAGKNCYEQGLGASIFKWLLGTSNDGFGIAKIVKWRQIADRAAVKNWASGLAVDQQLKMVLVCHGEPFKDDMATAMRQAAAVL